MNDIDYSVLKTIQKRLYNYFHKTNNKLNIDLCFDLETTNLINETTNEKLINEIVDFVNKNTISKTIEKYKIPDTAYIKKLLSLCSLRKEYKSNRRDKLFVKKEIDEKTDLSNIEKSIKSRALKRGYLYRTATNLDKEFNEKLKSYRIKTNMNQGEFCLLLKKLNINITRERLSLIEVNKNFLSEKEMSILTNHIEKTA